VTGRIVVLVSGTGSNMDSLIHACETGEVPGEVVAVIADRPCAALDKASAGGIETSLVEPSAYPSRDDWSAALLERVGALGPDLVVSAGFMRILAPVFVDAFAGKLINLHPSLLPSFPGAHAVRDALEAGVEESGTTVHFIDNDVDHGPVILQERVPVEPGDDEESLHERIKAVEHRLLPRACRLLLEGKAHLEGDRAVVRESF
jgi:phosphoribosylglycinamide formyltransferase 1